MSNRKPTPGGRPEGPPFGEYRRLICGRCNDVEREWWRAAGNAPFELVDAERHRDPIPVVCLICGGQFLQQVALADPPHDSGNAC